MAQQQESPITSSSSSNDGPPKSFGLPESILTVLPADPFDQLDLARKITSIALATRVTNLETESSQLRRDIARKDDLISELSAQLHGLSSSLDRAAEEKEALVNENASLSSTVKKLNRDVSKLEVFKKALMQSLQDEDGNSQVGAAMVRKQISESTESVIQEVDGDAKLPPPISPSVETQLSETGSSISNTDDSLVASISSKQESLPITSVSTTPMLTPPDSPPRLSATSTPRRLSKPVSPRRHSIAISSTRGGFNERRSMFSSMSSAHHNSITSPFDTGAQSGRARVDGKEFFRQVRSRLSYEQFSSFLANVKELNSHKQTREETLHKAEEIFGPDNRDLFVVFEGLISRNLH